VPEFEGRAAAKPAGSTAAAAAAVQAYCQGTWLAAPCGRSNSCVTLRCTQTKHGAGDGRTDHGTLRRLHRLHCVHSSSVAAALRRMVCL
jgi:hypothetical protein